MADGTRDYKPALRFAALTSLFDPVVALASRERAFKRRVVEQAAIQPGDAVLDLGCGTGTLAIMAHGDQPAATKRATAAEILRVLRPGGRLVVADFGRPHDPLMRIAVGATVQLLDGRATTSLNVAGQLPDLLRDAGLQRVEIADRLRSPTGTIDVIVARSPAMAA